MWAAPRDLHNRIFVALMALIALAWLALWLWGASPYAPYLDHEELGHLASGGAGAGGLAARLAPLVALFVSGWTLMVVAMMLPTSLPLVLLFGRLTRRRPDGRLLLALLLCGYVSVWALFGALAFLGDLLVHEGAERSAWLGDNPWAIGAGTLALAGLYQFAPLKNRCLQRCRSPLGFITEHWRGERERSRAFRLGAHHGIFCLGCCWSLMLVMFAVGAGSLLWMLLLGAVMAAEKNAGWGRRISAPVGIALLCWAAAMALGGVPALR
ncbi:conserved hypothetical protein [Rubrobacter xylanophilus DSM 9941]|uniref:Metal-binding integral membrane protein-like protein n=2 Tax=Rubrobacter xylanophilus TaxID=49319 RepID=Q1AYX7_RUBXD|nr:DUF2182 domain-containing protein [Rubrobacter xylanophilus]ABG03401.1 conserved hypothetical protein [Rubrobacter xylanophilus DSM 9941]